MAGGADIQVMRDTEFMVAHAGGLTEAGIEFIDAYLIERLFAVDSGRIIIHTDDEAALVRAARERGLEVTV